MSSIDQNPLSMKKHFLLLLIPFIVYLPKAAAQWKGFSIGPYGELAFPTGDFQKTFKLGGGVGLNADIRLIKKWAATGSVGYMYFRGKETIDENGNSYKVRDLQAVPQGAEECGGIEY